MIGIFLIKDAVPLAFVPESLAIFALGIMALASHRLK